MNRLRSLTRFREIAKILARYGFADVMSELGFSRYLPPGFRRRPRTRAQRDEVRAENLVLAIEELGPTFIKLGQFLSTHAGFLPPAYIHQLERLRDRVPPFPFEDVIETIEADLGRPLGKTFPEFTTEPMASASLAQVHAAVTVEGDQVAIKVRRPGIVKTIHSDIDILRSIALFASKHSQYREIYDFPRLVEEFNLTINEELDFRSEAENIRAIDHSLEEYDRVLLPKVYSEYSSERVLTLEKVSGFKITDVRQMRLIDQDVRREMAEQLLSAYLRQVLIDGFFHADPHPGNLFIQPEGKIVLIDLGLVGRLDSYGRSAAARLLIGFAEQEAEEIVDMLLSYGSPQQNIDPGKLREDIARVITHYQRLTGAESRIGEGVIQVISVAAGNRIQLPTSLALLAKTLVFVAQATKHLDPDIDYGDFIGRSAQQFARSISSQRFSIPRATLGLLDLSELLWYFPGKARKLLQQLTHNQLRIQFEHVGLEKASRSLEVAGNRLAFSIIVASIGIGSGLVMGIEGGPKILGYPALGVIGFIFAFILGLYLVISMIWSARKRQ